MNQHTSTLDDFTTQPMGGDVLLEIKESTIIKNLKPTLNDSKTLMELF